MEKRRVDHSFIFVGFFHFHTHDTLTFLSNEKEFLKIFEIFEIFENFFLNLSFSVCKGVGEWDWDMQDM